MKVCIECSSEKSDKGVYCKSCSYRHRTRPSGLKYNIKVKNRGWVKPGQHLSPDTEIKPNSVPWNAGTQGMVKANKGSFTSEGTSGSKNVNWAGDRVGYYSLHGWLTREYGKPTECETCGSVENVQWANKSYDYLRARGDWLHLCFSCHREYDRVNGWGVASKVFNLKGSGKRNG